MVTPMLILTFQNSPLSPRKSGQLQQIAYLRLSRLVVAGQGGFALREGRESLHVHTRQLAFARLTRLSPAQSKSAVASTSPNPFPTIKSVSLTVVTRLLWRTQPCCSPKTASGRLSQHKRRHQLQCTSAISGPLTQYCSYLSSLLASLY